MTIEITALRRVPETAKGLVRDIRVRWALEEAGLAYTVRKLDMRTDIRAERPAEYLAESPFGQVPAYRDGDVAMFESGAIVLRVGESSEALLPADANGRGRAISWLLAALNNVEPATWNYAMLRVFYGDQEWSAQARPIFEDAARKRLEPIAAYLGDKDWLEGRFTAGDLMMVCVLKVAGRTGLLDDFPTLAAYQARGEARPAYQRALASQLADLED